MKLLSTSRKVSLKGFYCILSTPFNFPPPQILCVLYYSYFVHLGVALRMILRSSASKGRQYRLYYLFCRNSLNVS